MESEFEEAIEEAIESLEHDEEAMELEIVDESLKYDDEAVEYDEDDIPSDDGDEQNDKYSSEGLVFMTEFGPFGLFIAADFINFDFLWDGFFIKVGI